MKEATGEVSMTVVVLIAVALIAGVLALILPSMGEYIESKWKQQVEEY